MMFMDGFRNTHKVSLFSEMSFVRLLLLLTLLRQDQSTSTRQPFITLLKFASMNFYFFTFHFLNYHILFN